MSAPSFREREEHFLYHIHYSPARALVYCQPAEYGVSATANRPTTEGRLYTPLQTGVYRNLVSWEPLKTRIQVNPKQQHESSDVLDLLLQVKVEFFGLQ
jgi:hypothetical protein